ncbi:MAG: transcription antitermination factor NusB [Clostridia bacterium]|nr:transcription antitermination factor NusB [Clostridia bacterium]
MLTRRESRQQAFEFIFEESFNGNEPEEIFRNAGEARDAEISDYARQLLSGVSEHREELDGYISSLLVRRSIHRLSKVVLAALRLAMYEIIYIPDLDPTVSINEAVELTKRFSGKDESGYVNGVLGSFLKKYQSGEIKAQEKAASPEGEAQ